MKEGTAKTAGNWEYDYKFLKDLTYKINQSEWGEGLSMEQVEAVLIGINFSQSPAAGVEREALEKILSMVKPLTYIDEAGKLVGDIERIVVKALGEPPKI